MVSSIVIRALRSRIYQPSYAVGEAQRRPILDTRRVGMDINQPGHYQLAARVDRVDGVGRDIGRDSHNPALRDRHVPYRVQLTRRIDDVSTLDDQVIFHRGSREHVRKYGQLSQRLWLCRQTGADSSRSISSRVPGLLSLL
jgi:hypothetical protein